MTKRPQHPIKIARIQRGWSQTEAAKRMGVRDNSVSRWETYRSFPATRYWPVIRKVLGVRIEAIIAAYGAA